MVVHVLDGMGSSLYRGPLSGWWRAWVSLDIWAPLNWRLHSELHDAGSGVGGPLVVVLLWGPLPWGVWLWLLTWLGLRILWEPMQIHPGCTPALRGQTRY